MSRLFKFISNLFSMVFRGEFAHALHEISLRTPNWFFRFNKAWIMKTALPVFPDNVEENINIREATLADIEDISQISGMSQEYVENIMKMGAVCFLASLENNQTLSISWSASGRCFIRGMAFEYDYGQDGYYSFASFTHPDARGKGLYLGLQSCKTKYELNKGANNFYGLVEFTNTYSRKLREKMSYSVIMKVTHWKILSVKICFINDLIKKKRVIRMFIKEPEDCVKI